jgi:acyl carrier protein
MNSAADVRLWILNRFSDTLSAKGLTPEQVPDDFDLMQEGVIDSLGFMTLVAELQEKAGVEIDFGDLDPENLTQVGALSRLVASQSGGTWSQAA